MTIVRPADASDWVKFYGFHPTVPWRGYVAEDRHMILGIGGIFMPNDGRWHAFMRRAPGARVIMTTYKAAKMMFDEIDREGLTIYAMPDDAISRSCAFLKRFGFVETTEQLDGLTYWKRVTA